MSSPTVSIIIPNWNGKSLLKPCLDSVYMQTFNEFEVIVIDCASTDGSDNYIRDNYGSVHLITLVTDRGAPNAINIGVRASKGSFLLILNNDVILPRELIWKMVLEMKHNEKVVLNPIQLDWQGYYVSSGLNFGAFGLNLLFKSTFLGPFFPNTACVMVRREDLLHTPLNENYFLYEDSEWGWRLNLKGIRIKVLEDAFFYHKYAGSIGNRSPKQAFYAGQSFWATKFICLNNTSFVGLLPLFWLSFVKTAISWLKRDPKLLTAYVRGGISALKKLKLFRSDKKRVQMERIESDAAMFRLMIGSKRFEQDARGRFIKRFGNRKAARELLLQSP